MDPKAARTGDPASDSGRGCAFVPAETGSGEAELSGVRWPDDECDDFRYAGVSGDRDRQGFSAYSDESLYRRGGGQQRWVLCCRQKKIVDAIYAQAAFHFSPQPMTAGPQMRRSTEYYVTSQTRRLRSSHGRSLLPEGALVSGDKKDVVVSNRLERNPGKIATFMVGMRLDGAAIQHAGKHEYHQRLLLRTTATVSTAW